MEKNQILTLITNPITDRYLENQFTEECQFLQNVALQALSDDFILSVELLQARVQKEWHFWLEDYQKRIEKGNFPHLWPFRQYGIAFPFEEEFDDFDAKKKYFSLGSDPSGDWFVMTPETNSEVYLCDQYQFDLYDYWQTPNHLLAWAVRVVIADENKISDSEIREYWKNREQKMDEKTLDRILIEL